MTDDRLVPYTIWGLVTVALYGVNLAREVRSWDIHHDLRGRRDAIIAFCLFLCALASCLSVVSLAIGAQGDVFRRLLGAIALGAFTGVGIVLVSVRKRSDPRG